MIKELHWGIGKKWWMVNGIVEIVYYAVLDPGMDTSRPKPNIICFTYSIYNKKRAGNLCH
jgi:hypothetical protein